MAGAHAWAVSDDADDVALPAELLNGVIERIFRCGLTVSAASSLTRMDGEMPGRLRDIIQELDLSAREIRSLAFAMSGDDFLRSPDMA